VRIAVVGAGAVGGYYGAKLAACGYDVHFLMRSDLEAVRRGGLRVSGPGEDLHLRPQTYARPEEIGACDLILVAIKTTANHALPELVRPLLRTGTLVLTLQNGLGNEEWLAQHFGAERVLGGLCFVCVQRTAPGVIQHYARGLVNVGEFSGPAQERTRKIAQMFERAGVVSRAIPDLLLERWRKLVWNIPFNGLAICAGGVDTQTIVRDAHLRSEARALMHEVIAAAKACGLALETTEADRQIAQTEKIGAYKPSTLIDHEFRRPLEVAAIWGEPLRQARRAGAKSPRMEMLYALLKSIDDARAREEPPSMKNG
jgi:2-dehydropantoate 2-reductase